MTFPTQAGLRPVEFARPGLTQALLLALFSLLPAFAAAQTTAPESAVRDLKQLSIEELMELEITSVSKQPEKLLEAPSAIQVVVNDEIRRSGASSIPEALRLAGNLHVARKGAHEWGISARGFNTDSANKMLVLMDGRAVYTPLFSGVFWDRQDYILADLDRIEVISGPGGTLWGANAVNGVINIISKNARDTQGGFLETGGGGELRRFTSARYGGELAPNVHYRVYGKHVEHDGAALASGAPANDDWRMNQGGFRLDAEPSAQNLFTLQGDAYSLKEKLVAGGRTQVRGGNVLGRWTRVLAPDSDFRLQAYYDRTHLTLPVPAAVFAPAGTLVDELNTIDLDFQHRFRAGERHSLVWGVAYRHTDDSVQNAPALAFFPAKLAQDLTSGFVQDEIKLSESVALTLGTKVEHNDYTGFETEPSARLQWKLAPGRMLWAAVSRAIRAPSRIDRDISQPAPGYVIVILQGRPVFKSEEVIAYELGYRAQVGQSALLSASAFVNDYDDIRSTSISPPDPVFGLPFPFYFENNLEARTYGIELSGSYQFSTWWRLRGSYTLLKEDIRLKAGRTDFNNTLNETADPEHQFSLRSSMDLPGNLELDLGVRRVGRLQANNAGVPMQVPGYTEWDACLGWQVRDDLEVSVIGRNLLHDQRGEYRRANSPDVEIERSVHGRITWRF
jgi:iron complex outermembrane recepter protein